MSNEPQLPGFDTDTTQDLRTIEVKTKPSKRLHARELGMSSDFPCPHCDFKAKANKGLQSHITYKHKRAIDPKQYLNNDIIVVAFEVGDKPLWDKKHNFWVYPYNINIPDGYMIQRIEDRKNVLQNPVTGDYKTIVSITCVKENKMEVKE